MNELYYIEILLSDHMYRLNKRTPRLNKRNRYVSGIDNFYNSITNVHSLHSCDGYHRRIMKKLRNLDIEE